MNTFSQITTYAFIIFLSVTIRAVVMWLVWDYILLELVDIFHPGELWHFIVIFAALLIINFEFEFNYRFGR